MGNKKNMKTLNTLSLIVTLTIFLANGSMSKNLNRNTTNSRPHLPAPGSNGSGINPNWKTQNDIKPPMESLPTPQNMPGFNGAGINPNSKPSLKIEKYKTIHDIAGENGAGINPNSKPTLEIQPMGPAPRKHAMPGANGTGINPNLKISTDIKPEHAMPGANGTGINPNMKISTHIKPEHVMQPEETKLPYF